MTAKVFHVQGDVKREVEQQGVNLGAEVLVRYADTGEIAIVAKSELQTGS